MSEFAYLTGRKELFAEAPPEAMVVLETEAGEPRILYAVAHEMGAAYWEADGTPGRPTGLIALFNKTRVVASRARADGSKPAVPKRDPIPNARMQRMQAAQSSASKAAGGLHSGMNAKPAPAAAKPAKAAPAPAAAKPTCRCFTTLTNSHHRSCPEFVEAIKEARQAFTPNAVKPADDLATFADTSLGVPYTAKDDAPAQPDVKLSTSGGFVSLFAMSKVRGLGPQGTFLTMHKNGNLSLSTALLKVGDAVDIQIDPAKRIIRVGKVKGGRVLAKSKTIGSTALLALITIPEGEKSVRIPVTEVDGWWQGEYAKA